MIGYLLLSLLIGILGGTLIWGMIYATGIFFAEKIGGYTKTSKGDFSYFYALWFLVAVVCVVVCYLRFSELYL